MDSVRFGRALGFGTRLAAKTLLSAVDAATSPNPSASAPAPPATPSPQTTPTAARHPAPPAAQQPHTPAHQAARQAASVAAQGTRELRSTTRGLAQGSRRFGQAVWGPVRKLSGVLWLELTGVFFGVFALSAAIGAWRLRANLHPTPANPDARIHLLLTIAIAVIFTYFCSTSFLRASRRGRRP